MMDTITGAPIGHLVLSPFNWRTVKMTRTLLPLVAAVLLFPAALQAQSANAALAETRFKVADTDKNGKLTKAEAKDGMPRIHVNFDRIDTNRDGFVTLAEIKAALAAAGQ